MALLCVAFWPDAPAFADGTALPGIRPLGTGGAMRAAATGDAGPMLNPSGIMLMRSYSAKVPTQYGSSDSTHDARVSVVDSTSAFNLGGGLFYTFHSGSPASASQTGHLGGVSLSFPLGDLVFLGGTAKYMHLSTDMDSCTVHEEGIHLRRGPHRPTRAVSFPGSRRIQPDQSRNLLRASGRGRRREPERLFLAFCFSRTACWNACTTIQHAAGKAYYVMGGAEYLAKTMAIRLGGGRDGPSRNGYLSGGLSTISPTGALDISVRQDISGDRKGTFVGVSARLFVPMY
jgi:hypothetical protein